MLLDFAIRGDGTVTDVVALDSDPPFVLDRTAVAAVGQWSYEPPAPREPVRPKVLYEFLLASPGPPALVREF